MAAPQQPRGPDDNRPQTMDYFSQTTRPTSGETPGIGASPGAGPSFYPPGAYPQTPGSMLEHSATIASTPTRPTVSQRSSTIGIRRPPSRQGIRQIRRKPLPAPSTGLANRSNDEIVAEQQRLEEEIESRRKRSSSEPQRPPQAMLEELGIAKQASLEPMRHMATIDETTPVQTTDNPNVLAIPEPGPPDSNGQRRSLLVPRFLRTSVGRRRSSTGGSAAQAEGVPLAEAVAAKPVVPGAYPVEYESGVVDLLDLVDPEVSTLSTLTNVQNSLFVPSLGRLVNRRPTYDLSPRETSTDDSTDSDSDTASVSSRGTAGGIKIRPPPGTGTEEINEATIKRQASIKSYLDEEHYAVLPHGVSLEGWSEEDKQSLDDHVRHFLHSRRSKFKRRMKGFVKYVKKPLGFAVTFYAFSITVFGLVWVLMLIGWISGGNASRHKYLINIIDNVLVALFAIVGDGLAPFRAVDTYHMIFIAYYANLTWRLRKDKNLPDLENQNDLPQARVTDGELEPAKMERAEYSVLTPQQQLRLEHHQAKFSKSHTFYKPHETTTHRAFSVKLLIAIVVLLDFHSMLQISLGAVTWGTDWRTRSQIPTTIILCFSIACNISGGILISVGDKRSRKNEVIEQMFRQTLTEEAMKKVRKHKRDERKKAKKEKEAREKVDKGIAGALPIVS